MKENVKEDVKENVIELIKNCSDIELLYLIQSLLITDQT